MNRIKPGYSVVNNIIFLLKDMWKAYPLLILYIVLQAACSVLSPLFVMILPKITIDLVMTGADARRIIYILGGAGFIMSLSMALSMMAGGGKYMMYNSMRTWYQIKLFYQSLNCDYDYIEKAEGQKKYVRAYGTLRNGDDSGTSRMTVAMVELFICIISFILYSGIISTLHPVILVILILLSSVSYLAARHAQKYQHAHRDENTDIQRKLWYLHTVTGEIKSGKDIRLYRMEEWFSNIWDILMDNMTAWQRRVKNRYFMAHAVGAFTSFVRDSIAYGYLIWAFFANRISVGDFVLYFAAVTEFSGFIRRIGNHLNSLQAANMQMNDMRAFLDQTDAPEPEHPADISKIADMSIEFRHVTFSYYADSEPVLCDVSFTIRQGEKLALVGVNGAGKTTIVKLLCGFYEPQAGEILIGGIDSRRFKRKDLFSLYSAVFQDIYLPPFSVAENVSLKPAADTDMSQVEVCLKMAGIYEKIMEYPKGCHTLMGREIEEGIVLSGGQKQKLLMARALYKDAPVLILDEPTAALDPIAESETYETFRKISKDKTTVFISHRLASTRFCDRIFLLDQGKIVETGTHEELLEKGGEYARMFEMQSHYYKEAGGTQSE